MVTRRSVMAIFSVVAMLAVPAVAQDGETTNMEILRQKMKADKKFVVATNMELTEAETKAFWPVYDAYQKDLDPLNQRLKAAILAYADAYTKGPISNETSKKLLVEVLATDEAEVKLKKSYVPKLEAVLPESRSPLHPDREQDSRRGPLRAGGQHSTRPIDGPVPGMTGQDRHGASGDGLDSTTQPAESPAAAGAVDQRANCRTDPHSVGTDGANAGRGR